MKRMKRCLLTFCNDLQVSAIGVFIGSGSIDETGIQLE